MTGPSGAHTIPITRPQFGDEEEAAVKRVLRSGWIMQGPEVAAFEQEFSRFVGAEHGAVAVSSGTAALHLALVALGIGSGDEVLTVSHSFIATANSVRLVGAYPVFVDVEPDTLNLDVRKLEVARRARTRAVLCVHQLGMPCDVIALREYCEKHRLYLIEDAACALGSAVEIDGAWQKIGAPHGHIATFSFHPRKLVTTGDGGMVTARDEDVLQHVRRLRQHGSLDGARFTEVGFNYRMTDVSAAIGRVQLARLPSLLTERARQVARYRELLTGAPVVVATEPSGRRSNWQSLAVRVPGCPTTGEIVKQLDQLGVSVRGGITNAHELTFYRDMIPDEKNALHESEVAARELVMLPLYPGLTDEDQRRVADALRNALA